MERPQRTSSDGIGRMLGGLGILLAVGGGVLLYQQNQALSRRIASLQTAAESTTDVPAAHAELAQRLQELSASDQAFKDKWDRQLSSEVAQFQTRADALLENQRQALEQRLAGIADVQPTTADINALVDRKLETLRKLVLDEMRPQLRVAENLMKVDANQDAHVAVIANDSDNDVRIDFVSFRPRRDGQFETELEGDVQDPRADWVIRFEPDHNTATEEGRHHHYERTYAFDEQQVPANEPTRLVIQIVNSKHLGWGLEGELLIAYDNGKTLQVPQVRAVFVAGPSGSS